MSKNADFVPENLHLHLYFDPFNLKPLLSDIFTCSQINLPTKLTPEMERCFTETLGMERVKEIIEGASLGPVDFFKAKECLKK